MAELWLLLLLPLCQAPLVLLSARRCHHMLLLLLLSVGLSWSS
jgi:hypothetical protein